MLHSFVCCDTFVSCLITLAYNIYEPSFHFSISVKIKLCWANNFRMKEVGRLCSSHEDSFAVSQLFGPMSTDRSTFSPDVELLKEASLLSKAVEDIPSQTGETLRVKDEKTILEFNLDHLKAYSLTPSTLQSRLSFFPHIEEIIRRNLLFLLHSNSLLRPTTV